MSVSQWFRIGNFSLISGYGDREGLSKGEGLSKREGLYNPLNPLGGGQPSPPLIFTLVWREYLVNIK